MQRPLRRRAALAAGAALALGLAGVGLSVGGFASAAPHHARAAGGTQLYAYVSNVTDVPFWVDAKNALNAFAAQHPGVKTEFVGPTTADAQQEASTFQEVMAQHPAGIMVFPPDETTLVPLINQAIAQGIPVITMIGDVPNSLRMAHIGIDNFEDGEEGAKLLCQAVGGKGQVVVGTFNAAGVLDRVSGYKAWLKANCPGVQVVQVVNDQADPSYAPKAYEAAIAAHPKLVGIGGTDGDSGLGAAIAVLESGKKGKIKIIAQDRNCDMLPYIENGTITASVAQKTYTETYLAVQMLYDLHYNRLRIVSDWRKAGIDPLPENIDTGIIPITRSNVKFFLCKP